MTSDGTSASVHASTPHAPASRPTAATTALIALVAALVFGVAETSVRIAGMLLSE